MQQPRQPVLVVCLNPTLQRTLSFERFRPGEVNRASSWREDASGKGVNVARVIGQLGGEAIHLTHAGTDERSRRFLEMCASDPFRLEVVESRAAVRICTTILDEEHAAVTELVEPGEEVDAGLADEVMARFHSLLPDCGSLVISGTAAPGYPEKLFAEMSASARDAGLFVLLDIRGRPLVRALATGEARRPSLLKLNLSELAQTFLTGRRFVSEHAEDSALLDEAWHAMDRLREQGVVTCVTRGSHPALAVDRDGRRIESAPIELTPRNTIGCGDAFSAGLLVELSEGSSLAEAIERGHATAAMNAASIRPGSVLPVSERR